MILRGLFRIEKHLYEMRERKFLRVPKKSPYVGNPSSKEGGTVSSKELEPPGLNESSIGMGSLSEELTEALNSLLDDFEKSFPVRILMADGINTVGSNKVGYAERFAGKIYL